MYKRQLLLHDCYATSVTAALEIVDRLQPRGVRFVTVEELFAVKGVEPACGRLFSWSISSLSP